MNLSACFIILRTAQGMLHTFKMQISERRMQNNNFVSGFRLTCKQNHLRFSQVVFPFFAERLLIHCLLLRIS